MVSAVDTALGLLLGASAFMLALSLLSYRRSGVVSLRLLTEGLSIHVVFTAFLMCAAFMTDWLERVDGVLVVAIDTVVLLGVVILGHFGGRLGAGPS